MTKHNTTLLLNSQVRTPKTHLSTAFWSWHYQKFSKIKIFIFPNFLEILLKKNFILWHIGFLDMFLCRFPKTVLKNTQTHLSTAFWSWHTWKFSKMKVFVFPNFLKIWFKKGNSILWHIGLLDMFLCRFPKTALKNTQNYLLQHFEVDISRNFQKWKFSFFLIFSNFFSILWLGSSDRLTNYW